MRYAEKPRWPFITVGAVLCAFTLVNLMAGNTNLGTYLPAAAGLPLLVYGIVRPEADRFFSHGAGRMVRIIAAAAYGAAIVIVGISTAAIGAALAHPPATDADVLIVLGAAVHGTEVTDTLEKRLDTALAYYEKNPDALIIVSGGMGSGENVSEASAMKQYLTAHGVPADSIAVEDTASNTRENFEKSQEIIETRFDHPVRTVFVTSDFHVLRAGTEAARAGLQDAQGLGAPTPFFTIPGAWMRESIALVRGLLRGDFSNPPVPDIQTEEVPNT